MPKESVVIVHSLGTSSPNALFMPKPYPSLLSMRQPGRPMQELHHNRKTCQPQLEEVGAPWQSIEASSTPSYS
jgi:hypothetical protein